MEEEPLGEIAKKVEVEEVDCTGYVKSAAGWACVEAYASYCVWDNTIYYNVDRIRLHEEELVWQNAVTFLKQLKRSPSIMDYATGRVATIAIKNTTESAALNFLLSVPHKTKRRWQRRMAYTPLTTKRRRRSESYIALRKKGGVRGAACR
ncbi:MAG: hypothetical protein QW680_10000 [Pyrobaculum sp.]